MSNEEIDWTQNCLTTGVHNGRPDQLWNIPILHAVHMFHSTTLEQLVGQRILNDALLIVKHTDQPDRFNKDWAGRVEGEASRRYRTVLQHKVGQISKYYESESFRKDIADALELLVEGKLNTHYAVLHPHDSLNMFCRILGMSSERKVWWDEDGWVVR